MSSMLRPWPSPEEVVALPVEELALRLLDRLASIPADRVTPLLNRRSFIEAEVTQVESQRRRRPGAMTVTHSDEALAQHPKLARAWAEAWDLCVGERWLAPEVERQGFFFVTRRGQDRLREYRAQATTPATPAVEVPPAASEPADTAIDSASDPPASAPPSALVAPAEREQPDEGEAPPRRRSRVRGFFSNNYVVLIVAGTVATLLATGILALLGVFTHHAGRRTASTMLTGTTTAQPTTRPFNPRRMTVNDAINHGTWALAAPTGTRLLPRESRPGNARAWLPDGTMVAVVCTKPATSYPVVVNGRHVRWKWWAARPDGSWVPVAPFTEAQRDGSQGYEPCNALRRLTVRDDVYRGAWVLAAPDARKLSPRSARPANAQRWLPNGARVDVRCVKRAARYPVITNGSRQTWAWWVRLTPGGWLPVAVFAELPMDGPQIYPHC